MISAYPGKKTLRRMGYLSDQNGILERYLQESKAWEEHLENTSDFIIRALGDQHPSEVVIFGSGWLLDLPIDEIYSRCRKIFLVDINHPPQVLHKILKYPGIIPVKEDITGGLIKECYNRVRECRRSGIVFDPGKLVIPVPHIPGDTDEKFILSLNILDQLDSLLKEYILRWFDIPGEAMDQLARKIQEAHVAMVTSQPWCIITDHSEILFNREGESSEGRKLLLTPLPEGGIRGEWTWKFDNHYRYNAGFNTWFRVIAAGGRQPV